MRDEGLPSRSRTKPVAAGDHRGHRVHVQGVVVLPRCLTSQQSERVPADRAGWADRDDTAAVGGNGDLFAEDCPGPQQGYGYFDKTFADGDVDDPWEGESTPDVGHGDRAADLGAGDDPVMGEREVHLVGPRAEEEHRGEQQKTESDGPGGDELDPAEDESGREPDHGGGHQHPPASPPLHSAFEWWTGRLIHSFA